MRRKVVAVLAIPVVLAAVFGGLRVSSELQDASTYSTNQQRAAVLGPSIDYLTATERLALPASLASATGTGHGDPHTSWTAASTALAHSVSTAHLTAAQSGYVAGLMQIGKSLASGTGAGSQADPATALSNMNRLTVQLITSTLNTQGTPDPHVQALVDALDGRLSLVKQQLLIASNSQQSSLLGSVWFAAEIGVEGTALDSLKSVVGGRRVSALVAANGTRLGQATTSKITDLKATPRMFASYDAIGSRLLSGIQGQLASSASASKSRALTDATIILTSLLASLLLALFVARALIVPLRALRSGALAVANERLPETVARIRKGQAPEEITPIPVHSHEELGQLARAVDDMHKQAVNLATGEAQLRAQVGAMFVTLSRRNTTLVNQQLALIESLEQDEEDPQRLEQLFSLDHLATRMRRTAESLVILGGTEGRTAGFEELSVSDVVHAAVSEVQDYQRVRIDAAPDRMISGRAASDVVHLMAELIDNALSYSPPGSPVTIQAAEEDGRVEIEIIDSGLGMAGDALARANESLKKGGEVTVDTARRMGLFVVSRLAEEHGLKVKLRRNASGGGIIASIVLPASVLVSDGPVEHVSLMDAPEEPEELLETTVEDEPEEEYDPYLERIEEAIAAVTGLPRRRPGQAPNPARPAAPAASVGMFDAAPAELPAGFEPAELPGREEVEQPTFPWQRPVAVADEPMETLDADRVGEDHVEEVPDAVEVPEVHAETEVPAEEEQPLAEVVSPRFGGAEPATSGVVPDQDDTVPADAEPAAEAAPVAEVESPAAVLTEPPLPTRNSPWATASAWAGLGETAAAPAASASSAVEESTEPVPAVATEPEVSAEEEQPVRLQIRRPLVSPATASPLEGDYVADSTQPGDSPIFGQLRSNWLSDDEAEEQSWSDTEVERGWSAAERVDTADEEGTTPTGLPVRRPGGRLVPGGVSQEPARVVRDPEAIRNRLAAHAAGVSRGRAAAAAQPDTFDYAHEETGPA